MAADPSLAGIVRREPPPPGHIYLDLIVIPLAIWLLAWFVLMPRLGAALKVLQPAGCWDSYWPLAGLPFLAGLGAAAASQWRGPAFLPVSARWLLWGMTGTLLVVQILRVPELQQVASAAERVDAAQRAYQDKHNKEIKHLEDALKKARETAAQAVGDEKERAQTVVDRLQRALDAEQQKQQAQATALDQVKQALTEEVEKGKKLGTALAEAERKASATLPPLTEDPTHPVPTPKPDNFIKPSDNNGQVPDVPPLPPPGDDGTKKVAGVLLASLALYNPELAPFLLALSGLFDGDPQTLQTVVDVAKASMKDGKFDVESFKDYLLNNVDRTAHANPKDVYERLEEMLLKLKNSPLVISTPQVFAELEKELDKRKTALRDSTLNRIFRVVGWAGVEVLSKEWKTLLDGNGAKMSEETVQKLFNQVQQKVKGRVSPQDLRECLLLYAKGKLSRGDYNMFDQFLTKYLAGDAKL